MSCEPRVTSQRKYYIYNRSQRLAAHSSPLTAYFNTFDIQVYTLIE